MSHEKILILFGTETGNSEELADQSGRLASEYGLEAIIKGMDEVTFDEVSSSKRVLIFCSTWGDGEQPYNAQDLFDVTTESENNSMSNINFAVLALGDTAFDMFCESGKEWDNILQEKGGNRVNDRIDCDTDYEDEADIWILATLELMREIE
ncbi:MAG: flavodoxin domain-containing protein [Candidatus Thalassarchaeaceae archaeon]|jgi:sulfite reductase (NADPH) flavoprotein alpha-component|nr:flavodoxin domain-containing protein [Candidatus Thalassarchaeaceae archaeon]|tara:strand:+ start:365 stop:820 length:456 start_codon:yes stop_codon:yes gene_type:complete